MLPRGLYVNVHKISVRVDNGSYQTTNISYCFLSSRKRVSRKKGLQIIFDQTSLFVLSNYNYDVNLPKVSAKYDLVFASGNNLLDQY